MLHPLLKPIIMSGTMKEIQEHLNSKHAVNVYYCFDTKARLIGWIALLLSGSRSCSFSLRCIAHKIWIFSRWSHRTILQFVDFIASAGFFGQLFPYIRYRIDPYNGSRQKTASHPRLQSSNRIQAHHRRNVPFFFSKSRLKVSFTRWFLVTFSSYLNSKPCPSTSKHSAFSYALTPLL